jgi:hypothetical protein
MDSDEKIMKKCNGMCGEMLELNAKNFTRRKISKNGFNGQCKKCQYKGIPSHIIEENGTKYQICTGECGLKLELNENNFYLKKNKSFKRDCKKCIIYKTNEYSKKHKKEKEEYNKIYRINNRLKHNIYENKRRKNKRKTDIHYKLKEIISAAIYKCLKNNNSSKNGKSCSKYLDYTIKELEEHIEKQFLEPGNEWMTWENQGYYNPKTWDDNDSSTWTWNLDHIIPQADLPYDSMEHSNFIKCWALENLRPYSAKYNIIDGATRIRHKKK